MELFYQLLSFPLLFFTSVCFNCFFFINKQDKKCQLIFICVKTKTFVDEMTHETGNMYSIHIIDRVFHYDTQWSVCGYVCVCGVHFVFVQFHLQPSR